MVSRTRRVGGALPWLLGALVPMSGCLFDGRLAPDGSGQFTLHYTVGRDATEFLERQRFSSPYVQVTRMKIQEDLRAEVEGQVTDVTRLATAEGFRDINIVRTLDGGAGELAIWIRHPPSNPPRSSTLPGPQISLAVPGRVHQANRHAEIGENHVTWRFSLSEWLREPVIDLHVHWEDPNHT